MKRHARTRLLFGGASLVLSAALASCGYSSDTFVGDAGDSGSDTAADTGADTPGDTPLDTAWDTPGDTAVDTVADTAIDPPVDDVPPVEHGECNSPADCGGLPCVRVPDEPGGYWICTTRPLDEATSCTSPYPEYDECCTSAECTGGRNGACFYTSTFTPYCGGPMPLDHNMCVYDECMSDSECDSPSPGASALCMPANTYGWPRSRCAWGTCKTASDCTAAPGGYCAPLEDYCCPSHIQGFFCIYPGNCDSNGDCTDYDACIGDWVTGGTRCDMYACPA